MQHEHKTPKVATKRTPQLGKVALFKEKMWKLGRVAEIKCEANDAISNYNSQMEIRDREPITHTHSKYNVKKPTSQTCEVKHEELIAHRTRSY